MRSILCILLAVTVAAFNLGCSKAPKTATDEEAQAGMEATMSADTATEGMPSK